MRLSECIAEDLSKNQELTIKDVEYYLRIIRDNCREFNTYKELDVIVKRLKDSSINEKK